VPTSFCRTYPYIREGEAKLSRLGRCGMSPYWPSQSVAPAGPVGKRPGRWGRFLFERRELL
jgi:hypothetical protein